MKTYLCALMGLLLVVRVFAAETASTLATLDFRVYTLTVVSDQGFPVPNRGTHSEYCWRSTVSPSVESWFGTYDCTGWIGTGSIPTTGATSNSGAIVLTDVTSTIMWQWARNPGAGSSSTTASLDFRDYTLTVASARGTPAPGRGTRSDYCWRSIVRPYVDGVVGGYHCSGWIGTGSIPAIGTTHSTGAIELTDLVSTITWQWGLGEASATAAASLDFRDYTLTVASAQGTPVPAIGTRSDYCWRSTVTPSVEAVVGGFNCIGWTGTGSIPAAGTTHSTGSLVLTDMISTITWQWSSVTPALPIVSITTINTTATTATLNGTVNPNGAPTTAQFEYGLTTAYGSVASVTLSPSNGSTTQTVSVNISGLLPSKGYHLRLSATNSGGTKSSGDGVFLTPFLPIDAREQVAPQIRIVGGDVEFTVAQSVAGRRYQAQQSDTLGQGSWINVGSVWTGDGGPLVITIPRNPEVPRRFYRLVLDPFKSPFN